MWDINKFLSVAQNLLMSTEWNWHGDLSGIFGGIIAFKPAIKPVILARIEPFYSPFTPIKPDM